MFWTSFIALIVCFHSYPLCNTYQQAPYSFDLSSLSSTPQASILNSWLVTLSPCTPVACGSQMTFFSLSANQQCLPFGSSQNTTLSQYSLVDPNNIKTGIKINYLPYWQSLTSTSSSLDNSTNITTIRTNNTIQSSSTIFNILCANNKPSTTPALSCALTNLSQPKTTTTTANNITVTTLTLNNTLILTCSYYTESGCPSIVLNPMWQYMDLSRIAFAIPIMLISLLLAALGYIIIRITLFIFGIFSGSIAGIIFTAESFTVLTANIDESNRISLFVILLSVGMGILFGIMLLTLPRLGYVNIGLWDGVILTLLLQNSVLYLTGGYLAFYITLGVLCFIFIVMSQLALRWFIMFSSSFISAFWLIRSLAFFLPYYPNELLWTEKATLNTVTPWQFYLYLLSILILTILGTALQYCLSKRFKRGAANNSYYFQDQGPLGQKFKRLLTFKQIRDVIESGKEQFAFFRKLITEDGGVSSAAGAKVLFQQMKPGKYKPPNRKSEIDEDNLVEMKEIDISQVRNNKNNQSKKQRKPPRED